MTGIPVVFKLSQDPDFVDERDGVNLSPLQWNFGKRLKMPFFFNQKNYQQHCYTINFNWKASLAKIYHPQKFILTSLYVHFLLNTDLFFYLTPMNSCKHCNKLIKETMLSWVCVSASLQREFVLSSAVVLNQRLVSLGLWISICILVLSLWKYQFDIPGHGH